MIKRWPFFLLDENSSPPAGGPPPAESAPASAPSAAPSDGGASPPGGAGDAPPSEARHDPFDGMESNDYYDTIDLGEQAAPTGDEPGAAAAPPGPGAGGEPPVAAPVTPAPQVQSQQPAAPPTAPAAPSADAGPPRSQLDQAMEGLKGVANQTALSDWAAQNLFKLSPEDITALDTNAADIIPKLMGRAYTHAMQSAVNLIKNLVPEMVNSGMAAQQTRAARASEALNEFYQSNPHLSADQHGAAVDRWARSFRAMNPAASRQEAIAFVGKAVSAEFGLWPTANGSGAPVARRAAPFAPARPGGRAPISAKGPHDPYAGMEDDIDQ